MPFDGMMFTSFVGFFIIYTVFFTLSSQTNERFVAFLSQNFFYNLSNHDEQLMALIQGSQKLIIHSMPAYYCVTTANNSSRAREKNKQVILGSQWVRTL
jgi:hypothetical protein